MTAATPVKVGSGLMKTCGSYSPAMAIRLVRLPRSVLPGGTTIGASMAYGPGGRMTVLPAGELSSRAWMTGWSSVTPSTAAPCSPALNARESFVEYRESACAWVSAPTSSASRVTAPSLPLTDVTGAAGSWPDGTLPSAPSVATPSATPFSAAETAPTSPASSVTAPVLPLTDVTALSGTWAAVTLPSAPRVATPLTAPFSAAGIAPTLAASRVTAGPLSL